MDHFCILFLIEKDVHARHERRTTCRWGISRLCVNRNAAAGIAAVLLTKLRARLARRQAPQERGRFRRQPTIFWTIPGESSGVSPRDWEKNRRPYRRESSEPHQGDIQGALPLDHFCILFLREKDGGQCPLPNRAVASFETKSWATRTVSRIKLWARLADRRSAA